MRMLIDTREQLPLSFRGGVFGEVIADTLPFGDYWAEEINEDGTKTQMPFCFERKGMGDLFGTMTNGYERFKREMRRAWDANVYLILLIEGSLSDVYAGYKHSQFKGESMLKKLAMLRVKYDLEYHFFNHRDEMRRFMEELCSAFSRCWSRYDPDTVRTMVRKRDHYWPGQED